jgi:hypothetical protein
LGSFEQRPRNVRKILKAVVERHRDRVPVAGTLCRHSSGATCTSRDASQFRWERNVAWLVDIGEPELSIE